jgi:hypothetical protein
MKSIITPYYRDSRIRIFQCGAFSHPLAKGWPPDIVSTVNDEAGHDVQTIVR